MKSTAICFVAIFVQYISIINGDVDDIPITLREFRAVKNSLDFTGKVALVTGSNSGLGSATVRLFSYLGAKVVVTGRNLTRIKQTVDECRKLSPYDYKPIGLQLDLTIPGNVAKLVNETIEAYGHIDILVNNAGIGSFATIQDPKFIDVYLESRAINEEAQIDLTSLVAPYIVERNGTIILMTSLFARNPVTSSSAYSMGKNALIAFAMTLTHDLGSNCRVNVISPTVIDGTRIFRLLDPSVRPTLIANQIASSTLKRAGVPMDIAKSVIYLSSPLASFINGKELQLDGGLSISIL
ncbi:3-oxoacyl-[acyl-carrier-protein] reductase FabG-like [Bradysia coprophila]|uniref:3-oxoacyl-[acyl-carrier-protein] reductase FabG-like n=1 Tax=Bradysia coprophila TaxID=38358 RepID=UPI00187DAAC1|nr:3-oxoacyl-[acyl-carrier-protein] reductase FabG-like [Bradysia coprophila]